MKQADYVGNNTGRCWISSESGLIWSFLGPVFLILFINAIILISSAILICTAPKQLSVLKQFRGDVLSAIILTPVLGLPWIVSLTKFVTLSIHNISAYRIIDTFSDPLFICLNAPPAIIFFFIILNQFRKKGNSTDSSTIKAESKANTNSLGDREYSEAKDPEPIYDEIKMNLEPCVEKNKDAVSSYENYFSNSTAYQNAANNKRGHVSTEKLLIKQDLAIFNPLYDPIDNGKITLLALEEALPRGSPTFEHEGLNRRSILKKSKSLNFLKANSNC